MISLPYWKKYKLWMYGTFFAFILIGIYSNLSICEPFYDFLPSSLQSILHLSKQSSSILQKQTEEQKNPIMHKRNVSNSTKKWVAANQSWKCAMCQELLNETYQVDHEIPLHKGGSNEKENLRALCPNCHAKKTYQEAMNGFQ
jgi:rubredoxin